MKKKLFAIFFLYISSYACTKFEVVYYDFWVESVEIQAFNTLGTGAIPIEDSVYMKSFGLECNLNIGMEKVGNSQISPSLFINNTYALGRTAISVRGNYLDILESFDIYMYNLVLDMERNVTSSFKALFIENPNWNEPYNYSDKRYRFELINFDDIADSVYFKVVATFSSGKRLQSRTQNIKFFRKF